MAQAFRRAAKVDTSQGDIVRKLRSIPGVSVRTGVDDIFVGWRSKNFWYELKSPGSEGRLQDDQIKLKEGWHGHYKIVSRLDQILRDMGIT